MQRRVVDVRVLGVGAAVGALMSSTGAGAIEFTYSGYLREHWSVNVQNAPEHVVPLRDGEAFGLDSRAVNDGTLFGDAGGAGQLSMIRHTGKLEGMLDLGFAQVVGVGRVVRENHTSYERDLQNASRAMTLFGIDNPLPNGVAGAGFGFSASSIGLVRGAGEVLRDGFMPPACIPVPPPDNVFCAIGATLPLQGVLAPLGGIHLAGADFGLDGASFFEQYDNEELREMFVQFDLGERDHFRVGRQQVVWGETDFFRAMDIIHGYDLRWRSFLELENEELRKPLILFNYSRDIPEIGGAMQLIVRPGWDKGQDIGNSLPLSGSRWAPQPFRGFDAFSVAPIDAHHNTGDEDDVNYGLRFAGVFGQLGWSLNYYRGQSVDPVVSRNPRIGGTPGIGGFEGPIGNGQRLTATSPERIDGDFTTTGMGGETVFPMVDTFGLTFNAYSGFLDGVIRGEFAFVPNQPYNAGKNTWLNLGAFLLGYDDRDNDGIDDIPNNVFLLGPPGPPVGPGGTNAGSNAMLFGGDNQILFDTSLTGGGMPPGAMPVPGSDVTGGDSGACWVCVFLPGLREVKEKPTLKLMLGFDKNLNWTRNLLGTQRPGNWTMQIFDTWILNYDEDDEILDLFGYATPKREHTTFVTNALALNYRYDTILPGIAFGFDAGNFDAFLLPFVDFAPGDHWRIRLEGNFFFAKHTNEQLGNWKDRDTRLLGSFANHDQIALRVTYQF
jgi:hypothetical protein